jgi:glycosyltransferase involved in cell wall biosynthesis
MLEAMFFKKIVIAKNVGGISEVIENLNNGFIYNTVSQGVQILFDISKNMHNFKKIQKSAKKTVELKYSNYVQAANYERIYDSVTKNKYFILKK